MKTIVLYLAVMLMAVITVTGCRKDVPAPAKPRTDVRMAEGGETPPQLPPRPRP